MIDIQNLYFSFAKEYYTLNDINFSLDDGKGAIIVGDKNSGKTSLVRILLGLEKFRKGTVTLNGADVRKINFKNDINVGYIPTFPPFLNKKTVEQNLRYSISLRNKKKDLVDITLNNTLIAYNLFSIKSASVDFLNYFDKIKLSIARLSIRKIDLLILDDIFSGLSEQELAEIVKLLKDLIRDNGCSVLIFADNLNLVSGFNYDKYKLEYGTLTRLRNEKNDK